MPWSRLPVAFLLLVSVLLAPLVAQASPRSGRWAHETSQLKPDERVIWGRLDNGVRYALLPHVGVPGRVALRFIVLSGSIDEQPDELGIAHFTEHMAFRGTQNYSASEMVSFFQRLGAEYGSDVNAITTFDQTAYMLEYRENTPALLGEGLKLFRDIAVGPTFDPAAIDLERRVILAEMRSRDSLAERQMQATFPVVFRGLRFGEHSPIGTEKHILSFRRSHFVKFHERCYRPDLMVIVAVGDFVPAEMAVSIRETFGNLPRPRTPIPTRSEGRLEARGLRSGIFRMTGVGTEAAAASVLPPSGKPETREAVTERQKRMFVMQLLQERLGSRVPGVGGAQAHYERVVGYEAGIASVRVPPNEWKHGVLAVDETIRNTHRNGFERDEVEIPRLRQLRYSRHILEQIPTLDPRILADALSDSITEHQVYLGLERENAWRTEWLEQLSPADVQQTFRGLWNLDNMAFHIGGEVADDVSPSQIIQQVQQYRKGRMTYLPPPLHREPLPDLKIRGQPSQIVERREVPDLGAVLIKYGNNVRLNFVSSRQSPGLVQAVVRVGTGLLDMPGKRAAIKEFGLDTVMSSGTARYRAEQLSRVVEERLLGFSFDVSDPDAFSFRAEMGVENLETFLGITAEYLSQPQFTRDAHDSARLRAALDRGGGFEGGMRDLTNHLFNGDPRFTWGTFIEYMGLGIVDVRRWMEPSLTRGYVELTVVGDLNEAAVVNTVARTLGALPTRAAEKTLTEITPAKVTAQPGFTRVEFLGEHHLALAVGTWPIVGTQNMRDEAALRVLMKVLELRIRDEVRDNLGLSYGPSASIRNYDGFGGLGLLQAIADCAPRDAERVARVMTDVAARLAAEGVNEGEFTGATGILRSQLRRAFVDNDFVLDLLKRAQERPETLERAIALKRGLIGEITRDEVNAWAAKVLPASNSRTAGLVPKAFIGIFESATP